MILLESPSAMRNWRNGQTGRVGFVPTMGALHAGHADLLNRMRKDCDHLVLSIFVNPSQFGPKEDLAKYPRPLDADLRVARECGVDAVFLPRPEQIYPTGFSTTVEESALTQGLCGPFRPGHFRGVTTVVLKLFNLVQPTVAYFGLKDAQQFFVLHKMARDLDLGVEVEGVATVREEDGLAMSSRNVYLSQDERTRAAVLPRILRDLLAGLESEAAIPTGSATVARLAEAFSKAREQLTLQGFAVQYLECVSLPDFLSPNFLSPHERLSADRPYLIAVAAYLGSTRLIDNVILRPELLKKYGIRVRL